MSEQANIAAGPEDEDFHDDGDSLGCYNCDGGWRHGCCDDLCRGTCDGEDCDSAVPCRLCNPEGEHS